MRLQVNSQPQGDVPAALVRQGSGPGTTNSTLHLLGPSLATTNLALPGESVGPSAHACLPCGMSACRLHARLLKPIQSWCTA